MVGQPRDPEIVRSAISMIEGGSGIDNALALMRRSGFDVIDCIVVLANARLYSHEEAKIVVLSSAAWADARGALTHFHDTFAQDLLDNPEREGETPQ